MIEKTATVSGASFMRYDLKFRNDKLEEKVRFHSLYVLPFPSFMRRWTTGSSPAWL